MSRIWVAHWGVLLRVVQRRGGGRGHVLRRAALRFDAVAERGQMRRGQGARLGREGAPSAGHPGNSKSKDKRIGVSASDILSVVAQVQLDMSHLTPIQHHT